MRKERRIYIFILCFLLCGFIGVAVWMRSTILHFEATDQSIASFIAYPASPVLHQSEDTYYVSSIQQLEEQSSIIAKVCASGKRTLFEYNVLTEATVLEVYKGDTSIQDSLIYIYEPAYLNVVKDNYYIAMENGYILMRENQEYIVFLNSYTQPEGYTYSAKDKATYLFVKRKFGKYPMHYIEPPVMVEQDKEISYDKVADCAIYPMEEKDLASYRDLYNQVKYKYIETH